MKTLRLTLFKRAAWLGHLLVVAFMFAMVVMPGQPALAQDASNAADPPGRVGRLAEVQGEVWIFDDEEGEWIEVVRNRPITAGDRLSSSPNGRAEVSIGSTTVRIGGDAEVEISALDDERIVLQLHRGDVAARLRTREAAQEFELVTPEGTFHPDRAGSYRFGRDEDTTEATVLSGQLQLRAADAGVTVPAGQRYRFWQDNGTQYELTELRRDAFDSWVASRDDREDRSASARYVSPEMTGVEDLDRYGRWEQDAEYGPVWIPRDVRPGWAPYRAGHWVWISPWGWTWVDDAPWGFAPFHYGRWVSRGNTWCWSPGRYVARPVYAPALVAWIGGGSVSINAGRRAPPTVGWFPLGPREVYVPGHRFTPHYMRHVNDNQVPNGFNFNPYIRDPRAAVEHGRYRHRGMPQAVTIVPRQVIERRQPVGPAIIGMNGRPLPGADRDRRLRPDAPVMPGGRSPTWQRTAPQTAIPAAPGGRGDHFGAPRFGRGDRPERSDSDRRMRDHTPSLGGHRAPQPGFSGGRDHTEHPRPDSRPGFAGDPGGRLTPSPSPSVQDDRWRQLRPAAPQTQTQEPAPRLEPRRAQDPDAHRPGGFNHMRIHPQPLPPQVQPQMQPQVQPAAPQMQRPQPMPQIQTQQIRPPRAQPPMPVPQAQPQQGQPSPQRGGGGGQELRRDRDEGPRHRRMD